MKKLAELVFIAPPRVGHIIPTIEAAKLITHLYTNFSATVLLMRLPTDKGPIPESRNPRLKFVVLRREESSISSLSPQPATPQMALFHQVNEHKSHVRQIIGEMSRSSVRVAGIVVDMFCTTMIDVAHEFWIPSYVFITTGASFLGLMLHMQSLRDDFKVDLAQYEDSDAEIPIPTYINPVSARVLPRAFFGKNGEAEVFINHAKRYRETKGILINTFHGLESHAIQALANDPTIPPVYAIGPVLNRPDQCDDSTLKWLDFYPDCSVVFLCFGSMGSFSGNQVKEIACALEKSGCRFLWCLRKPPSKGAVGCISKDYENLEQVLPEGFLERTAEVGKVIGWAPQVAILSHPAIGCFVSHCGWNSTLESIWCGVPMAAWPLYAEQQVNSFQLVKDLGMAVEFKMDYVISEREDIVISADMIQRTIEKLMDPEIIGVRKKVREMQERSWLTVKEEGSSSASLKCFMKNVIDNIPVDDDIYPPYV